jgi:hypothetical protein
MLVVLFWAVTGITEVGDCGSKRGVCCGSKTSCCLHVCPPERCLEVAAVFVVQGCVFHARASQLYYVRLLHVRSLCLARWSSPLLRALAYCVCSSHHFLTCGSFTEHSKNPCPKRAVVASARCAHAVCIVFWRLLSACGDCLTWCIHHESGSSSVGVGLNATQQQHDRASKC